MVSLAMGTVLKTSLMGKSIISLVISLQNKGKIMIEKKYIADSSEISWSPRIPIKGEKVRLYFNHSLDQEAKLILTAPDGAQQTVSIKPDLKDSILHEWIPEDTGWYDFEIKLNSREDSIKISLPVVWTQLHILSWQNPCKCHWVGTGVYVPDEDIDSFNYWRKRGSKILGVITIRNKNLIKLSAEQCIDTLVSRAEELTDMGYDGMLVDELGIYADKRNMEHLSVIDQAFEIIAERFPKLQIYNWTGGGLLREEASIARKYKHVLMTEIYAEHINTHFASHSFHQHMEHRFDIARNADILFRLKDSGCTVAALGIGSGCGNCFKPLVERRVRMYKRIAPEAPGICYYPGGPVDEYWHDTNIDYSNFLDELTLKYFINPVIMMNDDDFLPHCTEFSKGKTGEITLHIRNCGGMKARNVNIALSARNIKTGTLQKIDEKLISEIGNGLKILEYDRKSNGYTDTIQINGTNYPILHFSSKHIQNTVEACINQALVDFQWNPSESGYWELIAEILPMEGYTVLDGIKSTTIYVN
jgi:hypothetical protein